MRSFVPDKPNSATNLSCSCGFNETYSKCFILLDLDVVSGISGFSGEFPDSCVGCIG